MQCINAPASYIIRICLKFKPCQVIEEVLFLNRDTKHWLINGSKQQHEKNPRSIKQNLNKTSAYILHLIIVMRTLIDLIVGGSFLLLWDT